MLQNWWNLIFHEAGVSRCRASNVNLLCLLSVIVEGERYFAWQLTSVPRIHCIKDRRRGWFVLHWECRRGEMMVQRGTLKEFSCVYLLFHSANRRAFLWNLMYKFNDKYCKISKLLKKEIAGRKLQAKAWFTVAWQLSENDYRDVYDATPIAT